MTPPVFGRDCTVGDRLRLRCMWRAIGEYFYVRRGARRLEMLRFQMLDDEPKLERREVMVRVSMQWAAITRPKAESLVLSDQETFGEWRSQREASFRNSAVYLLVNNYLRTRCATGTQIDMQRIVARWVRHD